MPWKLEVKKLCEAAGLKRSWRLRTTGGTILFLKEVQGEKERDRQRERDRESKKKDDAGLPQQESETFNGFNNALIAQCMKHCSRADRHSERRVPDLSRVARRKGLHLVWRGGRDAKDPQTRGSSGQRWGPKGIGSSK